jgi:aquaporin Z
VGDVSADDTERATDEARANLLMRSLGYQSGYLGERLAFLEDANEWRRLFAEWLGTFLLVLVAVGPAVVASRFPHDGLSPAAAAALPGLVVGTVILSMGSVSGAHLNPAVTFAFALRSDFPWKRVPGYFIAQVLGGIVAVATLFALLGHHGTAGATVPAAGINGVTATAWELVLTAGLVTVILGTSSGAQNVGPLNAIGVGSYIALTGPWAAPVTGASMNPARSVAPALLLGHWESWWCYLAGPFAGALIAVGIAWVLRGPGGGLYGKRAAQGALGWLWQPGPIDYEVPAHPAAAPEATPDE